MIDGVYDNTPGHTTYLLFWSVERLGQSYISRSCDNFFDAISAEVYEHHSNWITSSYGVTRPQWVDLIIHGTTKSDLQYIIRNDSYKYIFVTWIQTASRAVLKVLDRK